MTNISVQNLLNGPGFNEKYMLEKAGRELARLKDCKHPYYIYDHIINFSVAVASVADWTFHLQLAATPRWKGRSEINFAHWIRSKSQDVAAFIDISNECKHADRKHPNHVAEKVLICPVWDATPDQMLVYASKGFDAQVSGDKTLFVVPTVKYDAKQAYLYDMAEAALKWWETVDLSLAAPMDKSLTVLPVIP